MNAKVTVKEDIMPGYWWVQEKGVAGIDAQKIVHVTRASPQFIVCFFGNDLEYDLDQIAMGYDFLGRVAAFNPGDEG